VVWSVIEKEKNIQNRRREKWLNQELKSCCPSFSGNNTASDEWFHITFKGVSSNLITVVRTVAITWKKRRGGFDFIF
jgi:hypothetical protein